MRRIPRSVANLSLKIVHLSQKLFTVEYAIGKDEITGLFCLTPCMHVYMSAGQQ